MLMVIRKYLQQKIKTQTFETAGGKQKHTYRDNNKVENCTLYFRSIFKLFEQILFHVKIHVSPLNIHSFYF